MNDKPPIEISVIGTKVAAAVTPLKGNGEPIVFKPVAEFCAEYVPLDYAVEGLIRTASLYTVTAKTGAGKTSFNVAAALANATGREDILGREVAKGRGAYLVAENPDDVRMRFMIAAFLLNIDLDELGDDLVILDKIPWGVDSGRLWEQTEVVNPLNPWRRPMSLDHRCEEPTAIRSNVGAIFVSLELSRSTWLITSLSPGSGEKMSKYGILAGDLAALLAQFSGLKQKAFARTGKSFSIVVIQEAGLDGFWIHRVLQSEGIESYVVDPASIATSRRRRRAKTDRIDGEALVRALLAYKRGEPRVCAIVSAPTPEDEDNRRLCRERKALTAERIQHVNRIKGLLFSQGVSDYEPLRRNRRQRLDELKTGDSRPLPMHLKAQIGRELDRLELLLEQIKAVEAERDALLASAKPTEETSALPAMLVGLKGIGPEFAAVLWSEGLYQIFANRKQVAAYAGLAPTPWQSGTVAHEQGVSKAGNPRLRTTMIQLAWLWLRHQPHSALAQWFKERVKRNGGRLRKTTIVALARKLLVALWKYVNAGVVIEGAVMKVSS